MSLVKIELLSDKKLKPGQKLYCHFNEDAMYDDSFPIREKYNLRFFDEESKSCGFGMKSSLFSEYNAGDIVQAMHDLEIDYSKVIEFEVISSSNISRNKKTLFSLKLLDTTLSNKILGISVSKKTEATIQEYLTDEIREKLAHFSNDNLENEIEVTLDVKGDAKSNPKKTTITRLIKNFENPNIQLQVDEKGIFRVLFKGEYAGEVLNAPKELKLDNIISVKCVNYIPLGYTILIKFTESKEIDTSSSREDTLNIEQPQQLSFSDTITVSNEKIKKEKKMKIDEKELRLIIEYLEECNIPEHLIKRVISSHQPYEEKYLDRIPHSSSKDFKPWRLIEGSKNLLLLAITQIEEGLNSRFVGGRGSGKGTLVKTIGWIYQRPVYVQSSNRDTDTTHLFGDKNLDPKLINGTPLQTIGFQTGLLIEAMEIGGIYEFAEGNVCKPDITMALHSILDTGKSIDVDGYKLVKAHPNFSFILTMNVNYDGCNELNWAFRDRFATIKFPPPKDISSILKDSCPYASDKQIKVCNRIYQSLLGISSDLQSDDVITIRGYIHTLKMARHIPLMDALDCCIVDNISDDALISKQVRHIVENIVE